MELEAMLRAAHRAGWLKGRACRKSYSGTYHRSFWDHEPLRAQLGFGPKAKEPTP